MVDKSVEFFDLFMLHNDLANVKEIELPDGYSYRFFNGSDEDIKYWVEIEASSGDVGSLQEGFDAFEIYYREHIQALLNRCIFILNSEGLPVGTATAFFLMDGQMPPRRVSINPERIPQEVTGHLHWVAIKEEYKGKGLSKPMITKVMKIMHELGHPRAFLHTQTPSWLAAKIYLDLGWKPFRYVQSEKDFSAGWNIVNNKIQDLKK